MKDQRVRQSICAVCRKTVGVGKGTVLEFGAAGRVHTLGCLQNAQKVTLSRVSQSDGPMTNGPDEAPAQFRGDLL